MHSRTPMQAGLGSQTIGSRIVAFKTLRCVIEVAYIFASVKAITAKFLVWENTTRKELQPLELISKITTEFAYNVISRGLHRERYCRIDIMSQGSGTYGSRARCGSSDDGIWLSWYFLNTIVTNEAFSVIFHLADHKPINNTMQHQKSH